MSAGLKILSKKIVEQSNVLYDGKIGVMVLSQLINESMKEVKENNLKVHIETSGAYPVTGTWDWFCLSPKKNKLPVESAYEIANELKVIIYNKHDFIFAEEQAEKTNKNAILFLQPEWSKKEEMSPLIVDYVMNNPKWRVSLQTHKYLNIP